uniref:Uncharacterized protein n=1 Tax=Hyaloperonospora arabidopsidis (strain Emoy2) TaxID=559515 RepID=M4C442_HYAAE
MLDAHKQRLIRLESPMHWANSAAVIFAKAKLSNGATPQADLPCRYRINEQVGFGPKHWVLEMRHTIWGRQSRLWVNTGDADRF